MSYETERVAIEAFFQRGWTDSTWTYGLGAEPFTVRDRSWRLSIVRGRAMQGSMGRINNRIDYWGNVIVSIFTDGRKGDAEWEPFAELVEGIFREQIISEEGLPITSDDEAFVRFSPPTGTEVLHPYVSASFKTSSLHQTNITAPFVRYEYR